MQSHQLKEIEEIGRSLPVGVSSAGNVCPFCLGGHNKDKSFSVTRKVDGNIVYFCHRAKCQRSGIISPHGSSIVAVHTTTKEHRVFQDPTVPLSETQLKFFEDKYGLKPKELGEAGFLAVPSRAAIYQPIWAHSRYIRGCQVRRYHDKVIDTYKAPQSVREPMISWYGGRNNETVVIVEDQLSAIKLSRYHLTLALNSASLSAEAIVEICAKTRNQTLILDKDAIATALKLAERWKNVLNITVLPASRDPKYWDDDQLQSLIETYCPF